jgi:hypothetical protein
MFADLCNQPSNERGTGEMTELRGSTGDQQRDMDAREALVEDSLALVFEAYDRAAADGVVVPVIFLMDCEDEIGAEIARAWDGDDAVDAALLPEREQDAEEGPSSLVTVLSRPADFEDCQRELPELFPYLAASFERPPTAGILVVVVAFGGAGTFTVPHDARDS